MPCSRATSVGDAPGARLWAAIVCFCSVVQRRRRSPRGIKSIRRVGALLRLVVCALSVDAAVSAGVRSVSGLPPAEWRVEIRASCNCTHSDGLHAGARLNWGAVANARVQALAIVEDFDVVEYRRFRLLAGVEADLVDVLCLE